MVADSRAWHVFAEAASLARRGRRRHWSGRELIASGNWSISIAPWHHITTSSSSLAISPLQAAAS